MEVYLKNNMQIKRQKEQIRKAREKYCCIQNHDEQNTEICNAFNFCNIGSKLAGKYSTENFKKSMKLT